MTIPTSIPRELRHTLLYGLYVITDERVAGQEASGNHERIARAAIEGGAQVIQLRGKSTPLPELVRTGHALRKLTRDSGVLLLVNDQPELALKIDADGVHLGPEDLSPREARRVLGENKIVGVSCGDEVEARAAFDNGADYIGAGAIFATSTKLDAGAPIGPEKLRAIVQATPLPVAAIGGIALGNIAEVAAAGARMACVISAVTSASSEAEMVRTTRALRDRFVEAAVAHS